MWVIVVFGLHTHIDFDFHFRPDIAELCRGGDKLSDLRHRVDVCIVVDCHVDSEHQTAADHSEQST